MKVRNKSIQSVILRAPDGSSTIVAMGEHEIGDQFAAAVAAHPLLEEEGAFTDEAIGKIVDPSKLGDAPKRKRKADKVPDEDGGRVERNG